ncbi:calcium calmodulin-dependent protein kinase type 1b [Diplodia corticola]|uniref:non-specific serine/threonine protein kinase n=1 Tax=Diplodia corticola TaxID=236234 RepID=A0A1J9SEI7_9PEZI|nr:calcium calmodulin-dependent protein kinase type 1b [Diplodia corticola]OJD38831.1 calcium calmodulin-dependent protein kinase type 1b [Diplodia corticola]
MDDFLQHFRLEATTRGKHTFHSFDRNGRRRVEKWTQERDVGRGAYGTVWLQRRARSNEVRAVKEVAKHVPMDHLKEIRAIAKFSKARQITANTLRKHLLQLIANALQYTEYFAQFFGWYEDQQSYYLAMEYMEHGSLYQYLRVVSVPIPEDQTKEIVAQLLEGLRFMHEHNYAHRDLKPGNVFIAAPAPNWWVKIGDFGISKRVTDDTTLNTTGVYTKAYCAPEMRGFVRDRFETDSYAYTYAVDIWSLGMIAFEISTLKHPFRTKNDLIAYYDSKEKFPVEELTAIPISQEGISLISRLLQPRPSARPNSQQALADPWLQSRECIRGGDTMFEDGSTEETDNEFASAEETSTPAEHDSTVRAPKVEETHMSSTSAKSQIPDHVSTGRTSSVSGEELVHNHEDLRGTVGTNHNSPRNSHSSVAEETITRPLREDGVALRNSPKEHSPASEGSGSYFIYEIASSDSTISVNKRIHGRRRGSIDNWLGSQYGGDLNEQEIEAQKREIKKAKRNLTEMRLNQRIHRLGRMERIKSTETIDGSRVERGKRQREVQKPVHPARTYVRSRKDKKDKRAESSCILI